MGGKRSESADEPNQELSSQPASRIAQTGGNHHGSQVTHGSNNVPEQVTAVVVTRIVDRLIEYDQNKTRESRGSPEGASRNQRRSVKSILEEPLNTEPASVHDEHEDDEEAQDAQSESTNPPALSTCQH